MINIGRETHTIISVSKKTHRAEIQFGNKWQRVTRKKHLNKDSPKTCIHFLRKQYKKTWKVSISSKKLLKSLNCGQSFRYTPSQASHTPFWLCVVSSYSLTALQYRKLPLHHGCHIIKLALGKMMKETLVCVFVWREDHDVEQNEVSPRGELPFDAPRLIVCGWEKKSESRCFGDKSSKGASSSAYLYGDKVMAILSEAAYLSPFVVYIEIIWCRHNRAHSSTLWPAPALSPSTLNLFFRHYAFRSAPRIPRVVGRGR